MESIATTRISENNGEESVNKSEIENGGIRQTGEKRLFGIKKKHFSKYPHICALQTNSMNLELFRVGTGGK